MSDPSQPPRQQDRGKGILPIGTLIGFAAAFAAAVVVGLVSVSSLSQRAAAANRVSQSLEAIAQAQVLMSILKDAETGQRGFLLTGEERYLEPYTAAETQLDPALRRLREATGQSELDRQRLETLATVAGEKMKELDETIRLRRAGRQADALSIVASDRGKLAMDRFRRVVDTIVADENRRLDQRQAEWQSAVQTSAVLTGAGSLLLLLLIAAAAGAAARDHRAQRREQWIREGQVGLARVVAGEQRLEVQAERVLAFLADYLQARVGAFYVADPAGLLHRQAVYALPAKVDGAALDGGSNLLAQSVKDRRILRVDDVPEGYLPVSSSLGQTTPRALLVTPAMVDGTVHGAIELGFLRPLAAVDEALMARLSETLAMALRTAKDRLRLQELLEETQRQAEELQTQQEELRVGNEELEEQGRALQESQTMLESQQTELEQTNAHLESQAQILERQNQALAEAQTALGERAAELERSNQVKSEFLANMSHELRTPLNSTLILARLLADNKQGNLSTDQVRFAETISSAGNDLLALINDILDFSKLEAGKVEVVAETVDLARTMDGLRRTFAPMAAEKALSFDVAIDPDAPPAITTDAQRLGQILRNLIGNAIKFTERGEVTVRVGADGPSSVTVGVSDTGVGVDAAQQEVIFEAFRQADGSTHRKYGGTGLGLSISRDLARLLGGDIDVRSKPGAGSTFTLTLPREYAAPAASAATDPSPPSRQPPQPTRPTPAVAVRSPASSPPPTARSTMPPPAAAVFDDDRGALRTDSRLILVVEDDALFAAILRDLAHEMGFQCIVARTAGEGLAAASTYRPHAILLDMNLPDHSGLGVLDQLKRNPQTRHIPVHVASVADYSREALELGAIGYALKPVKREELVGALKGLEAKFSQRLRQVLVVEDDARQRESIARLLELQDVRIEAVASGAEALARLQQTTFDCMVMDLHLPDLSGDELLEAMASRDDVSFPPVIVYTGRNLSADEERRLRRHSKSIIVKDARSPERLLDEVTLFLHQVESELPADRQRMLRESRHREATLEGRRILVVEDDVRNVFALSSVLEPKGAVVAIARNGREALEALDKSLSRPGETIDLVLMDIMMPEMDGYTAMREIRRRPEWKKLPIIALTAKAMRDDQEKCLAAGANDYIAKPLDVEKLLSLVRVWMPR